ncbi:MAG: DUF5696 domain-containing protein, partial [Treponema sp.]|nr:DUF5696 domain-containing protein [Treponema sp.]
DAARIFYIPEAIREERLQYFLDNLTADEQNQVKMLYRLYNIDILGTGENKNDILALYPDLKDGRVWVMSPGTADAMRGRIDVLLQKAGYTFEDYEEDQARHNGSVVTAKPVFNGTIHYELEDNSLVVSVPFDRLAYPKQFPIYQLDILPNFCTGGLTDEGYLFVPDGSGAIIGFNNGKFGQLEYSNTIYGWDEGLFREAMVQDNYASFPVFGIEKNNNALLGIIEDGSAYGVIKADVSGRNTPWNNVYAQFTIMHQMEVGFSEKMDNSLTKFETQPPAGQQSSIRFIPCTENGYVGMAKEYRRYILENNPSLGNRTPEDTPVAVEIIGAVDKVQNRLGIPLRLPLKLTSFREAEIMLADFSALEWKDVDIKLTGWFNDSVEHGNPEKVHLISELGGANDLRKLVSASNRFGYRIYGEGDLMYIRRNSLFDSFVVNRDAIRYISGDIAEIFPYNPVVYGFVKTSVIEKPSYIATPGYTEKLIRSFAESAQKYGMGTGLRSIGRRLGGDYYEKRFVSREDSMKMQAAALNELKNKDVNILIPRGNIYAVPYADLITEMPLTDHAYGITDHSVPFYQIVLHGIVSYMGNPINLAEDYTLNLLKCIESGAGLYFSFIKEKTMALQETNYRQFYANNYDDWIGDADALYKKFQKDFKGLYAQKIEDHQILTPEVTITVYEDGTRVIVNTGRSAYSYGEFDVGALSYRVIKEEGYIK